MIEERKMQNLREYIENQKKLVAKLKEEREHCTEPSEIVVLDKKIAEASGILFALERTKNVVSYQSPQPTERQILLSGINKYLQKKREKVEKATNTIKQIESEIQTVEEELEKATNEGNVDLVISCTIERNDLQKKLEYVRPMKAAAENESPFSDDTVIEEWKKICEEKRTDFEILLTRIEALAEEYRTACDELLDMNNTLLNVRNDIKYIARENGIDISFKPILTAGINTDLLTISKVDGMKPGFIKGGLYGTSL